MVDETMAKLVAMSDTHVIHRYRVLQFVIDHWPDSVLRLSRAMRNMAYGNKPRERYATTLVVKFERVWIRRLVAMGYTIVNDRLLEREDGKKRKPGPCSGGLWY